MPGVGSIDGIISGLNTTEIVDSIMKFERRDAVLLEAEQAQKTHIVSAYKALQAKFLALNTELASLVRGSSYEASLIKVSDETVLSASSDGRVTSGSYDVQVLSLARNHQLATQGFADQGAAVFGTGTIQLQVGDNSARTITIDSSSNSLIGIKQAINNADAGVTASIINDGSASNPYRLVLTADQSGYKNQISIDTELTGGQTLNLDSGSFDVPEILSFDKDSTARVSLGTTSSFTGTQNKIYTFTVDGAGSHTVGSDPITLNWSDGTNSGSVVVTQADTEVELVGAGADGLKISLSTGTLAGGDAFQVQSFAPSLQSASDARIALGAQGGLGSPIVVTSDSNTFRDVVGGMTLNVNRVTAPGETVTITTDLDTEAIKSKIQGFIKSYNSVVDFIDEQNSYDKEADEAGILFGDSTLWMVRNSISNALGDRVAGIESKFSQLYSIGIRTKADGKLAITDSGRLEDALRNNLDDVIKLMSRAGNSSVSGIEFISSTADTKAGENYAVDITQAATKGYLSGSSINDPAINPLIIDGSNNTLKLKVDGLTSEDIVLARKTYTSGEDLADEIRAKIESDENLGSRDVGVEWVSSGSGGFLKFTSGTYGSNSSVEVITSVANSAVAALGLGTAESVNGLDVQGTINGEEAEGKGQMLKGKGDSDTIKGLVLRVSLGQSEVTAGSEGTVTLTKGVAARLKDVVESLTKSSDGTFDRRIQSYQKQIDNISERVEEIDELLAKRRDSLLKRFLAMEEALGQMSSTSDFLQSQLAGINSNWRGAGNSGGFRGN